MSREVMLNRLRTVIGPLEYPLSKADVHEQLSDVTLLFADGEESLVAVVDRSHAESFEDVEDLEVEIFNNLPVEAVGEPGQSEGEG
jgi:hypothetical protein